MFSETGYFCTIADTELMFSEKGLVLRIWGWILGTEAGYIYLSLL
jgi:hypothetical protein